jgi:Ca2+-binding RTX toxin-like protein
VIAIRRFCKLVPALVATTLLALGAGLITTDRAGAFIAICASNEEGGTTSFLADTGEANRLKVGYNEQADRLQLRDTSVGFETTCDATDRFESFVASLGDRSDSARLTGTGGNFGALPRRFDAALRGDAGADLLIGHPGDNILGGASGPDTLKGLRGPDILRGSVGDDLIQGGSGRDFLRGGSNDDRLRAADGRAEGVACGPGFDRAVVDFEDDVRDCEDVRFG